ncbi:MAG TPA: YdeI/OmpD-associated family protein [Sphingobium sp.]
MAEPQRFIWAPRDDSLEGMFAIPLPFDPRTVFGKTRAPVVVTIGGHSYRSTVTSMGGSPWIPFRQSNRDAAGVRAGVPIEVLVALDEEIRTVDLPDDLATALDAIPHGRETWDKASFTHRREYVEALLDAKKPETRAKRLEKAVQFVKGRIKP